jgi:hypothetical protein
LPCRRSRVRIPSAAWSKSRSRAGFRRSGVRLRSARFGCVRADEWPDGPMIGPMGSAAGLCGAPSLRPKRSCARVRHAANRSIAGGRSATPPGPRLRSAQRCRRHQRRTLSAKLSARQTSPVRRLGEPGDTVRRGPSPRPALLLRRIAGGGPGSRIRSPRERPISFCGSPAPPTPAIRGHPRLQRPNLHGRASVYLLVGAKVAAENRPTPTRRSEEPMIVSKSPKFGHPAFDELPAAHRRWSNWFGKGAFASSRLLRRPDAVGPPREGSRSARRPAWS